VSDRVDVSPSGDPIPRRAAAIGALLVLLPIVSLGVFDRSFWLLALAAGTMLVVLPPLWAARRVDWFSPWSVLVYSVFLGVFIRAIYITWDYPDSPSVEEIFLRSRGKEFLVEAGVVVLLGMAGVTAGYFLGPSRGPVLRTKVFQSGAWSETRFGLVVCALLVLSWAGFALLVHETTGWDLDDRNLSGLRGVAHQLEEYRSYGYLRWMASLSDTACYLVAAKAIGARRVRWFEGIAFLLALATSMAFYFFVSSRGGAVFVLVNLIALIYYLRGRKLPFVRLALFGAAGLLLFHFVSGLRAGSGFEGVQAQDLPLARLTDPVILSNNFIDVSKTAHIMDAIPRQLEYQWGSTLGLAFIAWVPREWWPDKPVTNIDNLIGRAVFGAEFYGAGGMPPGLFAEMFWNFSYPGIAAGCLLVGVLVRLLTRILGAYEENRNAILLYVSAFMMVGVSFLGSNMTSVVISCGMQFLPMYAVLHFITKPLPARTPAATSER
jgi:hypothetical protein